MESYVKSLSFWDNWLANNAPTTPDENVVGFGTLESVLQKVFSRCSYFLDYGCGSGWGLFSLDKILTLQGGVGVDTSKQSVDNLNKIVAGTDFFGKFKFVCGDQNALNTYPDDLFDGGFCSNVLDVIPENVSDEVLDGLFRVVGNTLVVILNPYASPDFLQTHDFQNIQDNYFAKDGVLRINNLPTNEWRKIFSRHSFEVSDFGEFSYEGEQDAHRRYFVLNKHV